MGLYLPNHSLGQKLFTDDVDTNIDFDDAWFRTLFVLVFSSLKKNHQMVKDDPNLQYLELLLETYLHRKSAQNLFTLWKSDSDFDNWNEFLIEEACKNEDQTERLEELKEKILKANRDDDKLYSKFNENIKPKIINKLADAKKSPETKGIKLIVATQGVKTFNPEDSYPVFNIYNKKKDKITPYISSFSEVKRLFPEFSIFLIGKSLRNESNEECDLSCARDIIKDTYLSHFNSELSGLPPL